MSVAFCYQQRIFPNDEELTLYPRNSATICVAPFAQRQASLQDTCPVEVGSAFLNKRLCLHLVFKLVCVPKAFSFIEDTRHKIRGYEVIQKKRGERMKQTEDSFSCCLNN